MGGAISPTSAGPMRSRCRRPMVSRPWVITGRFSKFAVDRRMADGCWQLTSSTRTSRCQDGKEEHGAPSSLLRAPRFVRFLPIQQRADAECDTPVAVVADEVRL